MPRWPARRSVPVVLAFAVLSGGCTGAGVGPAASPTSGGPTAPAATAVASLTPSASPAPASGSPALATASPEPATGSASQPAGAAEPPAASLAVEGGDPVTGQLGSYTWNGGGSDSPWLPGAPMTAGAGERLTLTLADGTAVETWSARSVAAGSTDGAGATGLGEGSAPVTFRAPPPGKWSVQVMVRFAGDLGSAAYYWKVTVR